jgi:hypothetical protein
VLLTASVIALLRLRRATGYGPAVTVLKSELLKDRELFEQWKHKR